MSGETITIALCLGLNSVSAAAALSGRDRQNPVVVQWPKSQSPSVSLRLQSTGKAHRWGYDCGLAESYLHWGLLRSNHTFQSPQAWNTIHSELLRKRGLPSCTLKLHQHDEGLGTFVRLVTEYINAWLSSKWGDAASVPKRLLLVIPPYSPALCPLPSLTRLFQSNCSIPGIEIRTVFHIYGALGRCSLPLFKLGDSIISCYLDSELTAVTRYEVTDTANPLPSLREALTILLTTGAHDVAEDFGRLLRNDPTLGPKCDESKLARAKQWFLNNLHHRADQIVRRPIPDLGRIQINAKEFEKQVFSQVFNEISTAMLQAMPMSSSRFISLSGPLAVVPTLRSFLPAGVHVLESPQPDTCSCEGAVLLPSTRLHNMDTVEPRVTINRNQPAHLSFNLTVSATLVDFRVQLQRLKEIGDYQSIAAKEFLLAAEQPFRAQNLLSVFVDHCREFFEKYCETTRSSLFQDSPPNDRAELNSLHLAAALNDQLAVRIGLQARSSVNEYSAFQYPFGTFEHSPLHAAVWFNNDAKAVVELLLQSGATSRGFGHECPMHFAVARNMAAVLRVFEQLCRDFFTPLASDLLQLAIEVKARDAVQFLVCHGAVDQWQFETCPSMLAETPSALRSAHKPLAAMLGQRWVEEATLTLKRYVGTRTKSDPSLLVFDGVGDERTQMQQLLNQWMSTCPSFEDEDGQTALCWAVSLGYSSLEGFGDVVGSNLNFQTRLSALQTLGSVGGFLSPVEESPENKKYTTHSLKCVVVGDASCEKTRLILSYATDADVGEYIPTVFDNYSINIRFEGKAISLGIWDTSGQEDYDRLRPLSYPQTDVFLVVFSIASRQSFDNVRLKWIPELDEFAYIPRVLVGVHRALRDDPQTMQNLKMKGVEMIRPYEGLGLAKEIKAVKYVECDALTRDNLHRPFEEAIRAVLNPRPTLDARKKKRRFMFRG